MKALFRAVLCFIEFGLIRKIKLGKFQENDLLLNLRPNDLHRYVECLINLIERGDSKVNIVLPLKLSLLSQLYAGRNWKPYETKLLKRRNVNFALKINTQLWKGVNTNYFASGSASAFKVPVGPHPLFWTWPHPLEQSRQKSAIFIGASGDPYNEFDENLWQMPSRNQTIEFLKQHGLNDFISERIPNSHYLKQLRKNSFFIALPGVAMPICHNLYEATYFGCIPILHDNYLRTLDNDLQNILKKFTWGNHQALMQLLLNLNEFCETELSIVRDQLAEYWDSTMSSERILENVKSAKELIICAEHWSVEQLRLTIS